ncbi:unnamed protein product [Caenorhabditis auriculariae]|uniref:RILP-like protein homolog n=1 Tax=Caenorhabditis auriculariae TaxID=2777116 RepID=A0A8S1GXZ8_9PELO|nr:unnamed protein product [Caenorhabditis auriculariae]
MRLPLVADYDEFVIESCSSTLSQASTTKRPKRVSFTAMAAAAQTRSASPQSPSKHITVVDVYDLAASIGKDFERLIELYGNDCVRGIMPKVISALETLESLASSNDKENEEISELRRTVEKLDNEKQLRLKQHLKFEEELEQVEKAYRKDIDELQSMVKNLISENKSLSSTVSSLPTTDSPTIQMREEDVRMMLELKNMSHQQKEEIKALQRDVDNYACQMDNMQNSIEKLIRQNEELLRKNKSLQKQGRMIVEEKMEIVRRLEKTEETNIELQKMLCETDRACRDLQQASVDNEPRFTLNELREVLKEKNMLKGRVMELQEELDQMRPGAKPNKSFLLEEPETKRPELLETPTTDNDEDLPVYGPMPREPDEKLYPWKYERKDSGVRKFFRFFKELGSSNSPRRGSSANNSPRLPARAIPPPN